jgi:hypothetical protein
MTEIGRKIVSFCGPNLLDHDISDAVIHMMSLASKISDIEFNED